MGAALPAVGLRPGGLDWMMVLPNTLPCDLRQRLSGFEMTRHMPDIPSVGRVGIEKGMGQGQARPLHRLIEQRFGAVPEHSAPKCCTARPDPSPHDDAYAP